MPPRKNTQVLLAKRPEGWVDPTCFRVVEKDVPALAEGELLIANHWLSLDPYMRGRMNDARSYAPKVELGAVMVGGTVGEVVESRNPAFPVGASVTGALGWQTLAVSRGDGLRVVDATTIPAQKHLGVVGMPGVTAWIGLFDVAQAKPGETVVVSAAAGAVGSVVGQLAKQRGCRAVGIAGGPAKCAHVVRDLGFDACVDHRAVDFAAELAAATPSRVDVSFENVGGPVMDAVLARLNPFARVALCGLVSQYNETQPYGLRNAAALLVNRVRLEGFIVSDRLERWPEALASLGAGVQSGQLRSFETVAHGLASAPEAFVAMLRGENLGKQLVKLV